MIPLFRLVLPVLETTPQRWIQLAGKLPPELFQRKPAQKEWSALDLMHTVQGERALLQPFIDGCGPWKRYFSDHAVPPLSQECR
jgi:hypothetical protein